MAFHKTNMSVKLHYALTPYFLYNTVSEQQNVEVNFGAEDTVTMTQVTRHIQRSNGSMPNLGNAFAVLSIGQDGSDAVLTTSYGGVNTMPSYQNQTALAVGLAPITGLEGGSISFRHAYPYGTTDSTRLAQETNMATNQVTDASAKALILPMLKVNQLNLGNVAASLTKNLSWHDVFPDKSATDFELGPVSQIRLSGSALALRLSASLNVKLRQQAQRIKVKREIKEENLESGPDRWYGYAQSIIMVNGYESPTGVITLNLLYDDQTLELIIDEGQLVSDAWAIARADMITYENNLASDMYDPRKPFVPAERPPSTTSSELTDEERKSADAWWQGVSKLNASVTDSRKAEGNADLAAYLEANPGSTVNDYVASLQKPAITDRTVDTPVDSTSWWSNVLSGLGTFGSKVWDTVTDWGPTGLVGAYAGLTAVNSAKKSTIPTWVILGGLGVVALLIIK